MKVFCIGAHKTGTTSVQAALREMGFSVFPESIWYGDVTLRRDFYEGRFERLFALVDKYDACKDSPFNHAHFFMRLWERYPDARFILTVRDAGRMVESHKRWLATLHKSVFPDNQDVQTFVEQFWQQEYGQGHFIDNEERVKDIYEARNASVSKFFEGKSHQLLIMDLETEPEPWQRLCAFLELPARDGRFPHLNRTA